MKKYAEDREHCLKQQMNWKYLKHNWQRKIVNFKNDEKNEINLLQL